MALRGLKFLGKCSTALKLEKWYFRGFHRPISRLSRHRGERFFQDKAKAIGLEGVEEILGRFGRS